jgi:hypothetical protein
MFGYGIVKIYKSQFPFPGPARMIEPIGQMSPMGLLWTFMGYSTAYNVFTGGAECVGALLLLWRRTTTLGALVLMGVMSNVVLLNFTYDVPVKLFSSQLLLVAMYLAASDLRRLLDVLVLHRPTTAPHFAPHFAVRWKERVRVVFKGAFLVVVLGNSALEARKHWATWGDGAPKPALYGVWKVESFERGGAQVATDDPTRWTRLAVDSSDRVGLVSGDDSMTRFFAKHDEGKHTLTLKKGKGESVLSYAQEADDRITLSGDFRGARIVAKLRREPSASFPLSAREFHWVSEFPNNN